MGAAETSEETTVYPTHSCFDDVIEYLNQLAEAGGTIDEIARHTLVHGVLVAPDGHRFAHAWLELEGETIEAGIYKGERVWVWMSRAEFDASHTPIEETRYTIREAIALDRAHGPGPWKTEYRALCGRDGRAWAPKEGA